ncbi:MAG: hypothetical protein ABH859_05000 [Pseudomonadota bacterium]
MIRQITILVAAIMFCFYFGNCSLKGRETVGVTTYKHNKVFLKGGGHYLVGQLPDGWQRIKVSDQLITFYNKEYDASITTDAFCDESFVDRPLEVLAGELASALNDRTTTSTETLMLNSRQAYRQKVAGKMDGVPVKMDIVVVKKNTCNFDFVAVMPPHNSTQVTQDFETFFNGFQY